MRSPVYSGRHPREVGHDTLFHLESAAAYLGAALSNLGGCAIAAQTAAMSCGSTPSRPYAHMTWRVHRKNALARHVSGVLPAGTDGVSAAMVGWTYVE